ncbi:MAG: uroporphyrinogen decarboxylase family protein [Planctomycetota bacterium]
MDRRERLRRCYFHEETDRPAVYCRTGFPKDDPTYDNLKAYLQQHTELKGGWRDFKTMSGYTAESRKEPYSEDFERVVTTLHTPKGDLESSRLNSLKGQPGMHETYFIKTREDAERYLSLPMPRLEGDCSSFQTAVAQMGDKGIVEAGLGSNPGGAVVVLCGSETFAMMTLSDRDIIHALCERHLNITLDVAKFFLDHDIGPYFAMLGQEYIAPPLHGPKDFWDFNVKYDKPILDLIHDAGGAVHIHCHGSMKKVIQGFVEMGTDVLHPFEPPPMGDITPAEAKEIARGRMCLEGNIQINRMYEAAPKEIRAETEALIRDAFDDHKGLIVSPTASPYIRGEGETAFPQYKAMVDTVIEWKGT